MKKKKHGSIRLKIMIPVLILGIVAVASNFLALSNTRKVNKNASNIADHYMKSMTELSSLKEQIQKLHNLGLSHIIATDSESMIFYIDTIKENEVILEESLESYQQYLDKEDKKAYQDLGKRLEILKDALKRLCVYSANTQTSMANAVANDEVSVQMSSMLSDLDSIEKNVQSASQDARTRLAEVYQVSLMINGITILISILAILCAIVIVNRFVVRPITKAERELTEIIRGIDNKEGKITV